MNLLRVDHIGVVVRDLNESLKLYIECLGLKVALIEENEAYGVRIAFLPLGEVLIELLEPIGPGPIKDDLDTLGEGVNHIAFKVDDIDMALEELKRAGVPLVDETPKPGGAGARVAFLKREAAGGVSIELKEGGTGLG